MGGSINTIWMVVFGLGATALSPMLAHAQQPQAQGQGIQTGKTIDVPCKTSNPNACNVVFPECANAKARLAQDLSSYADTRAKHAYQDGILIDLEKSTAQNKVGSTLGTVCQPWANSASGSPEITQQQLYGTSASCGQNAKFTSSYDVLVPPDSKYAAYWRGMFVAYTNCFSAQVIAEIQQGQMRISTPCEGLADDVKSLFETSGQQGSVFLTAMGKNVENLCQQKEDASSPSFDVSSYCNPPANPDQETPEEAEHRGTACKLAAVREETLQAFTHLARCEIGARMEYAAGKHLFGKNPGGLWDDIQNNFADPIAQQTKKAAKSCKKKKTKSRAKKCAKGKAANGLQKFNQGLPNEFIRQQQRLAPSNGQCMSHVLDLSSVQFLGWLVPAFGFPGRRRRSRVKKKLAQSLSRSVILALASLWVAGCGGGGGGVGDIQFPPQCGAQPQPNCGNTADGGVVAENNLGFDAVQRAGIGLDSLTEQSGGKNNTVAGAGAESVAATAAAGEPDGTEKKKSGKPEPEGKIAGITPPSTRASAGSASDASGAGGSGALPGFSNGNTGPTTTAAATAANTSVDRANAADENETYSAGGGRRPSKRGSNLFGMPGGGVAPSDAQTTAMEFGARGPSGENPLGSADPDDYFSRIGVDWSLFKIVERRYQEKANGWALQKARSVLK